VTAAVLSACASVSPDAATQTASTWAERHAGTAVQLKADAASAPAQPDATRPDSAAQRAWADALAKPLDADTAVRLSLQHSPALQALLAESWARQATATAAGALPNPRLTLERVVQGDSVELGRSLSFGLLELLTLPQRARAASQTREAEQLQLAQDVLATAHTTRQQWVRTVAAAQTQVHLAQVHDAAEAGAELSRRMEKAGNTSRLQRLREESSAAEARGALARAEHAATAEREALVRLLGLDAQQAAQLKLPEQLSPVPAELPTTVPALHGTAGVNATDLAPAAEMRLDLQLARARWLQARGGRSADAISSWTDVELGLSQTSVNDAPNKHGVDIGIRLPLFDSGVARREARSASERAAAERYAQAELDAASQLRERASALRSAWTLARQQLDEQLPRQRELTEETLLRYNGMLIGVFELLAQARAQAASTAGALDAQRDYWLADAAWQAARIGVPSAATALSSGAAPTSDSAGAGH
jgi:outer membrane protein TolC